MGSNTISNVEVMLLSTDQLSHAIDDPENVATKSKQIAPAATGASVRRVIEVVVEAIAGDTAGHNFVYLAKPIFRFVYRQQRSDPIGTQLEGIVGRYSVS
jgi:hypothetical protein